MSAFYGPVQDDQSYFCTRGRCKADAQGFLARTIHSNTYHISAFCFAVSFLIYCNFVCNKSALHVIPYHYTYTNGP